jgi:hypothetical protein
MPPVSSSPEKDLVLLIKPSSLGILAPELTDLTEGSKGVSLDVIYEEVG